MSQWNTSSGVVKIDKTLNYRFFCTLSKASFVNSDCSVVFSKWPQHPIESFYVFYLVIVRAELLILITIQVKIQTCFWLFFFRYKTMPCEKNMKYFRNIWTKKISVNLWWAIHDKIGIDKQMRFLFWTHLDHSGPNFARVFESAVFTCWKLYRTRIAYSVHEFSVKYH